MILMCSRVLNVYCYTSGASLTKGLRVSAQNPDVPHTTAPLSPTAADPGRWVELHADALFRFAMLRVRNQTIAEELVQETFVAALGAATGYRAAASERTWLVGILKHKTLDHFRKSHRERPADEPLDPFDPLLDKAFTRGGHWKNPPRKWDVEPDGLMEKAEFWEAFTGCLSALPEKMARAFMLRMLDNEDPDAVCQVLEITATNLWMLLHRARGRLRKCLESKWFCDGQENE
jgi:RNA polymerase sigma-70 factor (ECF subfamily)